MVMVDVGQKKEAEMSWWKFWEKGGSRGPKTMSSSAKSGAAIYGEELTTQYYCFVGSGNPSLIANLYALCVPIAQKHNGSAGHYVGSVPDLQAREEQARNASQPFVGLRYTYPESTLDPLVSSPVSLLDGVIAAIAMEGIKEVYITFASVKGSGLAALQSLYKIIKHSANSQNIFCGELHVTENKSDAEALLSSFRQIAAVVTDNILRHNVEHERKTIMDRLER